MWLPQSGQKPRRVSPGKVSYHVGSPSPVQVKPSSGNATHDIIGQPPRF